MTRFALLALLIAPLAAVAQAPDAPRPRVGLVLSGGSAKGLAHVGAIRVIEDAGIPVDVVTGTSMSSIVGGLYATGYSVDQLDAIVGGRDWTSLFSDAVDRRRTAPEARLGEGAALVSLPIANGSLGLPSGLIAGQGIFELLAGLTWPVQDVRDFRQLPRPFAAVVVDAATGAPVRLDSGYLPLAIRASMSLPSLFAPVEIDGRRYLDGGLARNLPAEDALALGADVLVCVDVSDVAVQDAAPSSFFDVMVNAAFYQSDRDLEAQRALCDVLIVPDVDGLSSFAFDAGADWIARGAAAAQSQRPALDALAVRIGATTLDAPPVPTAAPVRIEAVAVRGVDAEAERLIRRRLDLALPATLGPGEVEQAVNRAFASGEFDLITYRVVAAGSDGRAVSTLVLDASTSEGDRVGFGFRYDTPYNAALLFSLTLDDLVRFGSTTRIGVRLGEQTELQATYLARLGLDAPLTTAGQAGYTRVPVPIFAGLDRPAASGVLEVVAARAYAGPVLFNTVLTGLGPALAHVRAAPEVAPVGTEAATWTYASAAAFATADSRDRTAFPSRGARMIATAEASPGLGATFQHVVLDGEVWVPLRSGVTAGARLAATRSWGSDVPVDQLAFVGGAVVPSVLPGRFLPLHGAETLEQVGPSSQLAAVTLQWEARPGVFARLTANAGRAGDGWTLDPDAYLAGLGLSVGAATPIGPVSVTASGSDLGWPDLTVSLGRSF